MKAIRFIKRGKRTTIILDGVEFRERDFIPSCTEEYFSLKGKLYAKV